MKRGALPFNGINGSTGKYLLPSLTLRDLEEIAYRAENPVGAPGLDPITVRGPVPKVIPERLETSGWAVLFPSTASEDERYARLKPLLEYRRSQATRKRAHYYREYRGEHGVQPNESAHSWLTRQGAGPGGADPDRVPYYLLLAGSPEEISFEFQYQLSVEYAVGRLSFDELESYTHYSDSVMATERRAISPRPRRAAFFAVDNPDDPATSYSSSYLMRPLLDELRSQVKNWEIQEVGGEQATKVGLERLLCGGDPPALLFTTSHGMGFEPDDPRLRDELGALLCRDWPGPRTWRGEIPPEHYFAASDIANTADLRGLIAFHFACFSAGIPSSDSFAFDLGEEPRSLAPRDLLARLPQKLLGKPDAALAVIGHIDRARGFSFVWPGAGGQPQTFQAVLERLMQGRPVGAATQYLGSRYSHLCAELAYRWNRIRRRERVWKREVTDLFIASIDARSYVVLGDPAVRLGPFEPSRP